MERPRGVTLIYPYLNHMLATPFSPYLSHTCWPPLSPYLSHMLATPVSPPWRTPSSLRPLGWHVDRVKLNGGDIHRIYHF